MTTHRSSRVAGSRMPPGAGRHPRPPLPTFLIIGAQKCGTTWLGRMLSQHPDVFLPAREVHYFNHVHHLSLGEDWYRRHFATVTTESALGDKTPNYLWVTDQPVSTHVPHVHRHVHRLLPEARLIAVVREPVQRAMSALRHQVRAGRIPPGGTDELLVGRLRHLSERQGILDMGRYMVGISAYLELYDPDQLLILVHEEDVAADPAAGLRRACRFLGIDDSVPFHGLDRAIGAADAPPPRRRVRAHLRARVARHRADLPDPSPDAVARLRDYYAPSVADLHRLLGRVPAGWWEP